MGQIVETWMPFAQFEKQYPEYCQQYLIKLNEYIVFYEILDSHKTNEAFPLYFSLEDAFLYLNKKKG